MPVNWNFGVIMSRPAASAIRCERIVNVDGIRCGYRWLLMRKSGWVVKLEADKS